MARETFGRRRGAGQEARMLDTGRCTHHFIAGAVNKSGTLTGCLIPMPASIRMCVLAVCILCARFARVEGDPFVRYMAGVELLQFARGLDAESKAAYYAKLSELTGMTAGEATKRLLAYTDNPEQWKKTQNEILALLEKMREGKKE